MMEEKENIWKNARHNAESKFLKITKSRKLSKTSKKLLKQKITEREEIKTLKHELKRGNLTQKSYHEMLALIKYPIPPKSYTKEDKRYRFKLEDFSSINQRYKEYLEIKLIRELENNPKQIYEQILNFFYNNLKNASCKVCNWIHLLPEEYNLEYLCWNASHDSPFPLENAEHHLGILKFYRGSDWHEKREDILKIDDYRCVVCSSTDLIEVHHIIPYRLSHSNQVVNLVTLCKSCHNKIEVNMHDKMNFGILPLNFLKELVVSLMLSVGEKNWEEIFKKTWNY